MCVDARLERSYSLASLNGCGIVLHDTKPPFGNRACLSLTYNFNARFRYSRRGSDHPRPAGGPGVHWSARRYRSSRRSPPRVCCFPPLHTLRLIARRFRHRRIGGQVGLGSLDPCHPAGGTTTRGAADTCDRHCACTVCLHIIRNLETMHD